MSTWFRVMTGIVLLAYPFLVYFGFQLLDFNMVVALIGGVFFLRLAMFPSTASHLVNLARPLAIIGLMFAVGAMLFQSPMSMQYYPVAVNGLLLIVFGFSWIHPPTMVEKFARLTEPDLPEQAILYTRRVTLVWCFFFLLNGLAAAATVAYGNMALWTLYNGFLSYLLIGGLMIAERIVRTFVRETWY